jgi:hypothetical protein
MLTTTAMMSNRKFQLFCFAFVCFLVIQAFGGPTKGLKSSENDDLTNKTDAEGKNAASDTLSPWIAATLKVQKDIFPDPCANLQPVHANNMYFLNIYYLCTGCVSHHLPSCLLITYGRHEKDQVRITGDHTHKPASELN